jgi:hypothetical protein
MYVQILQLSCAREDLWQDASSAEHFDQTVDDVIANYHIRR